MTTWTAPYRSEPLDAAITLPGSKSLTNRALILAALSDGPSRVIRPLHSRDADLMVTALEALGADFVAEGEDWLISPLTPGESRSATIDCGLAGTVMRFVPAVAALLDGAVSFDGDDRARERPMDQILQALRSLGVAIDDDGRGTLPFTVRGRGTVTGGPVALDASASSQFVSALLLAGPRFTDGIEIRHTGRAVPSRPHIAMTVQALAEHGVTVQSPDEHTWRIAASPIKAVDVAIEPDLSNAGAFVAAALVTAGRVRIHGWPHETTQAGDAWRDLAARFGGVVARDGDDLVVTGPTTLRGIDVDLSDVGELTPAVAAVCVLADGPSRLRGIAHLRGHETDRLAALAREFTALGGDVTETEDGLLIAPRTLHGGTFATYADHRIAHAGAVLGLAIDGIEVEDIATTEKTYRDFAGAWERFSA